MIHCSYISYESICIRILQIHEKINVVNIALGRTSNFIFYAMFHKLTEE